MNDLAIAIIFFNRPNHLSKIFEVVKCVKPGKLFLIQDGPRNKEDEKKITECRKIVENIDWECDVMRKYSEHNKGCGKGPSSGITWAFEYTDSLIVLEDDCLPNISFFHYCDELLEKYKNDMRVGLIAGTNPFGKYSFGDYDYGFVKSGGIWGWATWKNRWSEYDYYANSINNSYIKKCLQYDVSNSLYHSKSRVRVWEHAFKESHTIDKISYWDFQWGLTRHVNSFLTIVPKVNLVKNIGCDMNATHENDKKVLPKAIQKMMDNETFDLTLKNYPPFVIADRMYDEQYYDTVNPKFFKKYLYKVSKFIKIIYFNIKK